MAEETYVTIQDVAKHFVVSVPAVRSWMRMGVLPEKSYLRAGNAYRFRISEVEAALREHTAQRAAQRAAAMTKAEPTTDQDL
jgi:predicted DNA-binding transcriptional regulator AlpA